MKAQTLIRISGMALLAVTVSVIIMALVYALQNPHLLVIVSSIGWNR